VVGEGGKACDLAANLTWRTQKHWAAIQETLYLLSVPGMRESIKEGMAESVDECAKELSW